MRPFLPAGLAVLLSAPAAQAALYNLDLNFTADLGLVFTNFDDPTPEAVTDVQPFQGGVGDPGAVDAAYDPGGLSNFNDVQLSTTGANVSGVDVSAVAVTYDLGDYAPFTDQAPFPPGGQTQTSMVHFEWSGQLDLVSDMTSWAMAAFTFSVVDAESGEVLDQLVRDADPDLPSAWYTVEAEEYRATFVLCGQEVHRRISGAFDMEVVGSGTMALSVSVKGAAGPSDCTPGQELHELVGPWGNQVAIHPGQAVGAAPLSDVPTPGAAALLLGGLGALALRRRG